LARLNFGLTPSSAKRGHRHGLSGRHSGTLESYSSQKRKKGLVSAEQGKLIVSAAKSLNPACRTVERGGLQTSLSNCNFLIRARKTETLF
jgi:hypothetical protein